MKNKFLLPLLASALIIGSCDNESDSDQLQTNEQENSFALKFNATKDETLASKIQTGLSQLKEGNGTAKNDHGTISVISSQFSEINAQLANQNIALAKAHVMLENQPSIEVLDIQFEPQLGQHFVPNDPRNGGDLTITYNSVPGLNVANGSIPTHGISDDAYQRWENNNNCGFAAQTTIVRETNNGVFNSNLLTFNGQPGTPFSDVNIVGHIPQFIFTDIFGLPPNVLGVAFSFVWLDGNGNPTDIDNDNFDDTAFVEIWYNDNFTWTTDTNQSPGIDLASIITHEQGHSLGLGHVGVLFNNNGTFTNSPVAVMNAIYIGGSNSNLQSSDLANYCFTYLDWNNF